MKRNVKNVQTENIKNICDLFIFAIVKIEILSWMFTEQRSSFFFTSNGRDGLLFVFYFLLFCAALLVTVLFRFQNQQ